MRLNRLELTRYGKFTDHVIDFGAPRAGVPDLHIIYGPNEAGKSTTFAAWLDLLFGIETQSAYAFLHPYATMRIGASLQTGVETMHLTRIKRPQNSLLDQAEAPVSEMLVQGALSGLDRRAYQTMFSLDDETLKAGGESILASEGDLGQLLFSASAGLADLSRGLMELRREAEDFYKPRGRTTQLGQLKAELGALKEAREKSDTLATHYAQLLDMRDKARALCDEALAQRTTLQMRRDEIQALLNAWPRLIALRRLQEDFRPFADCPPPPDGWRDEVAALQQREAGLFAQRESLDEQAERLGAELSSLRADPLAHVPHHEIDEAQIERLRELKSRHITAKDIPGRQSVLSATQAAISDLLLRLGRPDERDARNLLLGSLTINHLRSLLESRSGVDARKKLAEQAVEEAQMLLDEAEKALASAGDSEPQSAGEARKDLALAAVVATLRRRDFSEILRSGARSCDRLGENVAQKLQALRPWVGDMDRLEQLIVPDSQRLAQWKRARAKAVEAVERHQEALGRAQLECARLQIEIDVCRDVSGVVTEHEAMQIRRERDEAWVAHRSALQAGSAALFEAALRQDDSVTQARLNAANDFARIQEARQKIGVLTAECARLTGAAQEAGETLAALDAEIGRAFAFLPGAASDLAFYEDWLARRAGALEAQAGLAQAQRDLQDLQEEAEHVRQQAIAALVSVGVAHDPQASGESLLTSAQNAIEREAALARLREAAAERRRALGLRQHEAAKALGEAEAWAKNCADTCAACWIGAQEPPTPDFLREILDGVIALAPALDRRDELVDRIEKMARDQSHFIEEATKLSRVLAMDLSKPLSNETALAREEEISARLKQAQAHNARRRAAESAFEAIVDKRRALDVSLTAHQRRQQDMCGYFNVETLMAVAEKLREGEKKVELQNQIVAAIRDILEIVQSPDLASAEALLDSADRDALKQELATLQAQFDAQDLRVRDLHAQYSKASDQVEAVGGDDAVAILEQKRQSLLEEIEAGADRYLRLRIGIAAAEQALALYRDRHRSAMLTRASEAFCTISRGAYRGLATQPDKSGEILIAQKADGGSKQASALSKGARFQLYLALRVAGYHEFARVRTPPPFIADDIMETFDDFRAEEAFRLFADMAGVGQVIYLTHHKHLCAIAQSVAPDVTIHEMA